MTHHTTTYNNSGNTFLPLREVRRVLLLLIMLLMGVGSAWGQTASVWDGTVAAKIATGSGTQADPYIINSAAELAYFGKNMNGKTWYVKLGVDIDLDNREWTYGKNSATNFKGHFDGGEHTISNLKIVPTSAKNNGFFCSLQGSSTSRAEVKDLIIDGVTISQTADLAGTTITGALAGNVTEYTDITNVTVKNVSVEFKNLTNTNYVGAFIGRVEKNKSTLTTCSVESPSINITGEIKGAASFIGGAIGQFAGSANLVSTIDGLTVTSPSVTINKVSKENSYIGAVFGRINTYSTIDDVDVSDPTLTYKNTGAPNFALNLGSFAGGIFGVAAQETAVTNIDVTGDAAVKIGTSNNVQNVKAGLIGQSTTNVRLEGWTIENSNIQVNGNLATASSYLGGFVGYVVSATNAPVTIKKTHVTGNTNVTVSRNVSIACYIGGQFGYLAVANAANNSVIVDDFEVDENKETKVSIGGNVGGGANYVGGFIGYAFGRTQSNTEIVVNKANIGTTDVTVEGTITGAKDVFTYIGGYVGLANSGISKFTSCSVSPTVNINGDIQNYAAYIGGAFGDFAGAAGYTSTIDGLTIGTASMTVNKVSVAGCYIGSVFGRINTYTTVNKVTANNPALTYNNTDNPGVALNLGTFAGYITGVANMETPVTNVTIGGTAQLTLGTEAKQGTTEIKAINAGLVGTVTTNARLEGWTIGNSNIQVWGNLTTTASKLGGLVGYAASANLAQTRLKDITITGATNVNVPGDIGVASYVGGVIGDVTGVLTHATIFDGMNISSPSVSINNCSVEKSNIGSVFGRIQKYNEANNITVSNPTLAYNNAANSNVSLFFGTFAGYIAGEAATKETPVTNVTINGTAQLTIGTETTKESVEAKNIKAGIIGQATTNVRIEEWTVEKTNVQVLGKLTTAASQIGAFAGNITGAAGAPTTVKNVKINKDGTEPGCNLNVTGDVKVACQGLGGFAGIITTNCRLEGCEVTKPTVTIGGDINTATSYIGGAIGYFLGAAGNTSYIKGFTVNEPNVDINTVTYKDQCIGAVFGRINTYTNINKVTSSSPKITYPAKTNPNGTLNIGSFAGYLTGVKEQETLVTGLEVTGTAELTIGTDANKETTNVINIRAGAIGNTTTNVRMENSTIASTNVQVYGNLATSTSYIGGLAGYMESGSSAPLTLKNVKITGNSTVNVTGNIIKTSYIGGFAGYIVSSDAVTSYVNIDGAGIDGTSKVSVGGDVTTETSYGGGFAGYMQGRSKAGNYFKADNVSIGTTDLTISGQITKGSYFGGIVGRATISCAFSDWKIKTASKLTFNDNITDLSYVGGAIGSLDGAAGYPSSATGFDVKGVDINLNCDITTKGIYVGGIAGQLNALDKTNKIEKSSVSGKIHATGSHTYTNGDLPYTFGGIVGYLPQTTTTFSEVNNCVSEVDFDLSGLTPATAGNMYSGFVVGGVIGRINTPSRLPESLYYSGKIYAPSAAVGPIVGVFVTKVGDNKYIYDDYTGVNATAISAEEWAKADDWYFNGYKIGLSSDVTSQTLNTTASPVEGYLTIGKETLTNANPNSTADKISKTILAYAAVSDISPAWTTNKNTYPAYYMYYMQGVNRGNYLEDAKVEQTKKDILSGKLTILVLTDKNADFTQAGNRGFISHALTATATGADSYKWYVDGVEQTGETSENFTFIPSMKGNTVAVEAIKNGKALKRVDCKVYPVFRVKDISNDTELYGTKTNPYLIGSTDELQLLSYLSTLPLNTPWEKTYTSDNHYNKAYYELDNDIDLSGVADFTPISFATGFKANNGMNLGYVFDGVFDGQQHKISYMKEEWYGGVINAKDSYLGWGLFSVVGSPMPTIKVGDSQPSPAVIRNLIIDGATLTHQTGNKTFNYDNNTANNNTFNNVGIGVLAGVVLNNTKIDNIEIRNSQITDEGSSGYSLATGGLYVGGTVGSIQNSFNEQANAPVNTKVQHVAAQVDITLEHPTFADATKEGQLGLFNIGGIIGRYCATSALQDQAQASMPAYTLYSGSVTASKAWISPVLGATRYAAQQGVSFGNFSKHWEGNNNSTATQITITNAQYYNFYIKDKLITELYPEEACSMWARPISFHTSATEALGTYSATKYQGVNYSARFIDSEGTTLRYLCEGVTDGVYWIWNDGDGFPHMTDQPYKGAYLKSSGQTSFTAIMENGTADAYQWQISSDGETWVDIPDVSTQSCTPASSANRRLIVAIITVGGKTYRTQAELVLPTKNIYAPFIAQSGNDSEGYTFTVNWNDNVPDATKTVTYQWYHNDKTTPYTGATESTFSLTKSELDEEDGLVWCEIVVEDYGTEIYRGMLRAGRIVVFVDGAHGVDNTVGSRVRGWTPGTAVKTIDNANLLLDGGTWDNNIVVVIGTLNDDGDFRSTGKNPATLTGQWDGTDYHGIIKIKQINPESTSDHKTTDENYVNPVNIPTFRGTNNYVLADTKFEYLTFQANNNGDGNNFIECHGNDVWFGKGLVMTNFANLSKNHGNLLSAENIPEFTIILTATNLSEEDIRAYTNRVKPQVVTFESGRYGRIMGGRFTNGFFAKAENTSHTILGSAEHPIWAVLNIKIDKDNPNIGTINRKEEPNKGTVTNNFTCDINCIIAGLTDGTMYGDYEINVHGGDIRYIVGANQGNPVPNGTKTFTQPDGESGNWGQWPNSSYFGRTVINVEQDSDLKPITITNLYAGGLGREANGTNATSIVDMYMYGHTEINMKSGTVLGNVYGGGAGGVIGLSPWDMHVPYATTDAENATNAVMNGVQYGEWGPKKAGSPLANVTLHDPDDNSGYLTKLLNLGESYTTLNISGGTINGSVYGGGCGYVSNMPEQVVMQGVGSVFGTSNVNISGGTIHGSVYGGSEGSDKYYNATNKYGQKITNIAEMNGTVNMTITCDDPQQNPLTIDGSIYGAGKGIETVGAEEYLRIATAGNADLGDEYKTDINITIDMPTSVEFPNDIYGGGALGKVDGTTNIILKQGKFTGSIYGGGFGELQHLDKAMVTGTTNIYTGAVNVADVNRGLPVSILPSDTKTPTIYGGGNMAQVTGNTYINLYHGNITADVFGGGKGLTQSQSGAFSEYGQVTGNTRVLYYNKTDDNKLTGNIYGGGALGAVVGQGESKYKGTTVIIKDGVVDGDVFGGGKGEEGSEKAKITGNTSVIVDSSWKEPEQEPDPTPDPTPTP